MNTSQIYSQWDEPDQLSKADRHSLAAAERAIEAWLRLPLSRQIDKADAGAKALFDCSFSLLESSQAKAFLAQAGAELSLDRDNGAALSIFLDMGASFPKAQTPEGVEDYDVYHKTWQSSIASYCAKNQNLNCMEILIDRGILAEDAAYAAPLLRLPEPSPLRQINKELLDKIHRDALPGEATAEAIELADFASEFTLSLMQATSSHSERLSLSIARTDALQSPLYVLLDKNRAWLRNSRTSGRDAQQPDGELLRLVRKMAFGAKLFEPELESHRCAMLGLALDGSPEAAQLCLDAKVSPCMGGPSMEEDYFERAAAEPSGLLELDGPFGELCAAWGKNSGSKIYEHVESEALRFIKDASRAPAGGGKREGNFDWDAARAISRLANVCDLDPQAGFAGPSQDQLAALRAILDETLLNDNVFSEPLAKAARRLSEIVGRKTLPTPRPPRL